MMITKLFMLIRKGSILLGSYLKDNKQIFLKMIQPINETRNLLLSIIKKSETLIKQIDKRTEETLEFKMIKSKKKIHFKLPLSLKEDRMVGLTRLGVCNSIFNITEQNNKFELYLFPDSKSGGFS